MENVLATKKPATVILADYFANANFLFRMGVSSDCMLPQGAMIFAVDPWDCERTGYVVDMTSGQSVQVGPHTGDDASRWYRQFEAIAHKLKPVPMVAPSAAKGRFCTLPRRTAVATEDRELWRQRLGFGDRDRAVLFCTNRWQHQRADGLFKKQADALPRLLAQYIARLGESVHLVHLGPEAYDLGIQLGKRYHWLPPVAPADFESMIAGMDLMVSANISATTIAKAMTHGVPVLVLQNSVSVTSCEDAETALASGSSVWLRAWLEQAVPLLPFSLWPVGFHRFLTPLLRDNPYVAALDIAEILDERGTEATLAGLLFEPSSREDHLHRQTAYLNQIRSLPTGAETIKAIC
ncbi:MAG TPA: DUF6365 family protein [Terriglobales bacterium]|nr:DUF6365 family protein [Terriglobales bacterium]